MSKLNAKELRKTKPEEKNFSAIKRNPIYLILDNVIDTYNIGSLFRLSDAAAIEKLFICGNTEYPPSSRIHKAAVGTEAWVPWEKRDTTLEVVKELKEKGIQIISVEQDKGSISYKDLLSHLKFPCAVVVGNETDGIDSEVLNESDLIIEFPMFGINKSFNVWGSAAVIIYKILEKI
jgi:23S rRNA (guanosine2251-2'-O)-methyltransferase